MYRIELKSRHENEVWIPTIDRLEKSIDAAALAIRNIDRYPGLYDDYRVVEVDAEPAKAEAVAWTPEPWTTNPKYRWEILAPDCGAVAMFNRPDHRDAVDHANAARAVACVNACKGIANPAAVKKLVETLEWVERNALHGGTNRAKAKAALALADEVPQPESTP